jgi:hypothetical protein
MAAAGFTGISVEPTRVHSVADARHFLVEAGIDADVVAPLIEGKFISAFIRATKPGATKPSGGCSAPGCCN